MCHSVDSTEHMKFNTKVYTDFNRSSTLWRATVLEKGDLSYKLFPNAQIMIKMKV